MSTVQYGTLPRSTRHVGALARLRVGPSAAGVGAVALLISWLGSWNPSYWGDEAATVLSAQRPLSELFAEVRNVDAVHALYYLFMHFWIGAFGSSELSTRFPSAIAVGALVAGTVVVGARLAGLRYGLIAGLICLVLPRTTYLGTEARSYALGTAAAVWITVWFIGLLRRRDQRLRPWLIYGVLVGLASCLFLYLILLLLVHGAVLATSPRGRRQLGRWFGAALVAGLVAAPIVVMGYLERSQIAFLALRKYPDPVNVLVQQWFISSGRGAVAVPILAWALILLGTTVVIWRTAHDRPDAVLENRGSDLDVLRLGLAWLVLPTAILLAVDAGIAPIYNARYLSFSTPAAALLIALGVITVGRLVAARLRILPQRLPRRLLTGTVIGSVVVLLAATAVPGYLAQRGPYAKDGGSDWRQSAEWISMHAQQGDAVVFDETTEPWRQPELAYRLYPGQFAAVSAPEVLTPYSERAGIWDQMAPLADTRSELLSANSVWALELPHGTNTPQDVEYLTTHGYRVVGAHLVHRLEIYQLQKENV